MDSFFMERIFLKSRCFGGVLKSMLTLNEAIIGWCFKKYADIK